MQDINFDDSDRNNPPVLWLVVPCYNEEAVLPETAPLFARELRKEMASGMISSRSKVLFVNDGSSDSTWEMIKGLAIEDNSLFAGLSLSRNRGHQNALLAGLMEARPHCDVTISIDCDGQDDIGAISRMLEAYDKGFDVVYGVRSSRATDSLFKRLTAESFYKFLNSMGAEVVFNHADYRLLSSRALEGLAEFSEANLFLRGLVPLVGYPSTTVEYERAIRLAGESHYSLRKMLHLAFDGITSLSTRPIRMISGFGFLVALIGLIVAFWALVSLVQGRTISGWTSLMCLTCFIGGGQLVASGVIGEYIGKVYLEVKQRPRWIISERTYDKRDRLERDE